MLEDGLSLSTLPVGSPKKMARNPILSYQGLELCLSIGTSKTKTWTKSVLVLELICWGSVICPQDGLNLQNY